MKALVTGSAGFAGQHYVRALADRGYKVFGVDVAYGGDARIAGYQPGIHGATGQDARDYFRHDNERFDLAIHCAAIVGGRAVIEGSPLALAPNLELDSAFFQWAERTKPCHIVYISSSAVYPVELQNGEIGRVMHGQPSHVKMREDFVSPHYPRLPDQLYGWAKLTGEMLAARYNHLYTIVRPFSGYGEDQDEGYPFRAFAERAKRREDPFVIWGPGGQVRDFIHIDDVVAGTLAMVDAGVRGPVNLGTGLGTSMTGLALMMCEAAGYQPDLKIMPEKPAGVAYRVADIRLMNQWFEPLISLEEGVRRAVAA